MTSCACSRPRVSSVSCTAVSRTWRSMPSRRCSTWMRFAPASPTHASSRASEPGRSGTRVNITSRRPASVSWRRATVARRPASTLPPLSTTHVVPRGAAFVWPPSSAATPTAPAPSTTSLAFSMHSTMASATSSSGTTTTSSSQRRTSGSVRSPGRLTAMPSAIVNAEETPTGSPRRSDSANAATVSTCTPTTSTSGRCALIAMATPLDSPPPPTGTTTFARSGTSSSNSSPSVPWPAMTSASSNGWTNAIPASSARARACTTQSSTDAPPMCTTAPSARQPSTFDSGASTGMNTSHRTPRVRAACAHAQPWLPALPAVTPRAQRSPRAASLFSAPRILNDPVRWRFSAFRTTAALVESLSVCDGSTGVWRTTSATAARARAMSAASTVCSGARAPIASEASVRQRDDRVHLDLRSTGQGGDADRRARGRVGLEVGAVDLVDLRERRDVRHVDRHPHSVRERDARLRADRRQVLQALARLIADRALDERTGRRVDRDLAGAEQQPGRADGVAVRTGRLGRVGRGDGLAVRHGAALLSEGRIARTLALATLAHPMRARTLLAAPAAILARAAATAPAASAAVPWAPCTPAGYQCGRITVPLAPSGATAGTLSLAVKRRPAPSNPTATAVIGLAGGPGQAAIPFVDRIATNIAPALATRDLVILDQRGTGQSGALRCGAFAVASGTIGQAARSCANEIGPTRGFYRTAETVEDIEAVRREGGYAKLVLYGTSYGTKVAEAYAARYPANVEALVLDSVVLPEGPDVFGRSSFESVGTILRQLCGTTRCRGISGDPRGDVAALVRRVERRPLRGPVTTSTGRTTQRSLDALDLVDILFAGDFDRTLRADLPAAVRAALRGDVRPVLRLDARATGGGGGDDDSISSALFATTTCEESAVPWTRTDSESTRATKAIAAAPAPPPAQLGPFDQAAALASSVLPLCANWPNASPAPVPQGPVPPVPTLIVSGGFDVRTPTRDARALAARIAGAQLLEVPYVGHSTIGADDSGCARAGVAAFFGGRRVAPCTTPAPAFAPTRIPPTRLARVPGAGRAQKTIGAVEETLQDATEMFAGVREERRKAPRIGTQVGGLRGGSARWTATGIRLRRAAYVPGVLVSGFVPRSRNATTRVTVSGPGGAHGTVRILAGGRVVARLDGRRVTARVPAAAAAARAASPAHGFVAAAPRIRGVLR